MTGEIEEIPDRGDREIEVPEERRPQVSCTDADGGRSAGQVPPSVVREVMSSQVRLNHVRSYHVRSNGVCEHREFSESGELDELSRDHVNGQKWKRGLIVTSDRE